MKKSPTWGALALAACAAVASSGCGRRSKAPAAEPPGPAAEILDEAAVRADMKLLTSDALQGRLSLRPGDDQAARYIADVFAAAGLEPAARDERGQPSYFQAVPLIEFHSDRESSQLTLHLPDVDRTWKSPHFFAAFPEPLDLTAPLVFGGYGISAPELGYDDYAGVDVRGKVVLVFEHEPQELAPRSIFNGTGNTRYASWFAKVKNAQAHGALAVILAPEPSQNHPSAQEIRARIGHQVEHAANPIPSQALAGGAVGIPNLTISAPVRDQLLASAGSSALELQKRIDAELQPNSFSLPGASVSVHLRNRSRREATASNVVGLLRGSDPALAAETIVLSAHHDHDGESGGKIWAGADDNASGTAGVMALARAFTSAQRKPKRSLLFAVFAAEERGLLGSHYFAAHPLRPLETTRAVINFDMIGRDEAPSAQTDGLIEIPADTANRLNLIGASYSPDYLRIVNEENAEVGLLLDDRFDRDSALNALSRSDHYPFALRDIPALWWFTGFHPDYHHPGDVEAKINYPKMMRILRLAYRSAARFANDARPPSFVAAPNGARSQGGQ